MKFLLAALALLSGSWAFGQTHPDAQPVGGRQASEQASKSDAVRAEKLLQIGIGSKPVANVRAIIVQRMGFRSNVMQQIKVEMSIDGKIHQIVLAPMQSIGYDFVDDGVYMKTYSPDEKCLIIQPSARLDPQDLSFRMALIRKNYKLDITGSAKIAGRSAVIVEAEPKSKSLDKLCYSIDEKTGLLLRLQSCATNGNPLVLFETKVVDFPEEFSEATFQLRPPPLSVSTKTYTRKCVSPESAEQLTSELGFKPIVPNNLPHGFAVQQLQSSRSNNVPAVLVRVTDGLAKATIFQWKGPANGAEPDAPDGMIAGRAGRLTLLISGDLPNSVLQSIMRSFEKAARSEGAVNIETGQVSWAQELLGTPERFDVMSEPEGLAALLMAIPFGLQI